MSQKTIILSPALAYLRGYKAAAVANIVYNVLATFFAILSFVVLKPFLDILFIAPDIAPAPINASGGFLSQYLADFNIFLRQYIRQYGRQAGLVFVCSIILLTFFFKNLFRYLALHAMAPARNGIERDLRQQILDKILFLPLTFFSTERKGDLMARFGTDVQEIQHSILRSLETFVRAPVAILGSLAVMLYISPLMTGFSFLLMIFVGVLIGRLSKSLKRNSTEAQTLLGQLFNVLEETLSGLRILRAFGAENYQSTQFKNHNEAYFELQTRIQRRRELSSPLTEFLGIGIIATLLLFGGHLVFEGYFEASTFVVFIMMFYNIIEPAKSFSSAFYDIQKGAAAAHRIAAILQSPLPVQNSQNIQPLPTILDIEFQNISFQYPNTEAQILDNINLRIPFGQTVAIVGASGSGKSTLIDLLPRFYEPTQGNILLGAQNSPTNISDIDPQTLRHCFGIVSQEPILFNDSVANNIALGLPNAKLEDITAAAKLANAHDFIAALPDGYQTSIGDRGGRLSGGQRQRIALARAILRQPPILILDEATSALDSESEQLIQQALAQLRHNRTMIVIAHRFSTIQAADHIVVLEQGKIIEQGQHAQLIKQRGAYHKFYQLQDVSSNT